MGGNRKKFSEKKHPLKKHFDSEEDEFECCECDFSCSSESDMIEHSTVHQSLNNTIEDGLRTMALWWNLLTDYVNIH